MSDNINDPFEIAKANLKKKSLKFIQTQVKRDLDVAVVINYFLAMEAIELEIFKNKIRLESDEEKRFDDNQKLLIEFRDQIKNNTLKNNLNDFSLGFLLGALISLLRKSEGSIERYNEYLEITKKIKDLETECQTEEFLAKVWKKTVESIAEILSYLNKQSETFYPTVMDIFEEFKTTEDINKNGVKIIIETIKKHHNDREGFFFFSNIIQINPFLHEKVENLSKNMDLDILSIRKIIFTALRRYRHEIEDRYVLHLIDMFLNNPNYSKEMLRGQIL